MCGGSKSAQMKTRVGLSNGKGRADSLFNGVPVAGAQMPDDGQLRTMGCQNVCSEARFCAESGRSPVQENVICCVWRLGQLRGKNTDDRIRRSARYVALAITTAGRTFVSWAPTRTPTTTSPGFNPGPLILQRRAVAATRLGTHSGPHRTRNRTSRSACSAQVPLIVPRARIALSLHPEVGDGRRPPTKLPSRLAAFPYPYTQYKTIGAVGLFHLAV